MIRHPLRAKKISNYLAKAAPAYFAGKLKNPFFIIGCNRSGTTMLVDTLAAHRDIAAYPDEANELWHPQTFPWLYSKLRDQLPPIGVNPKVYTELSLKYRTPTDARRIQAVFGAYQFVLGRKCFLNKSAMIAFMIPYILDNFPKAKLIHIVRDGRGVALSWAKKELKQVEKNLDVYRRQGFGITFDEFLKTFSESWKLHIYEIEAQKKALDLVERGVLFELRYEDFCSNPQYFINELFSFIGIPAAGFRLERLAHITSMNYKYREDLNERTIEIMTGIMEPALEKWGYI